MKVRISLIILFFLATLSIYAQDYFVSSVAPKEIVNKEPLWNPDRGLHLESIYQVSDQEGYIPNPYGRGAGQGQIGDEVYPDGFMDTRNVDFKSEADSITLTQLYIYLTAFWNTDQISQAGLDNIQLLFDGLREHNVKAILRFAYSRDDGRIGNGHSGQNPTYTRLMKHMEQIKPLITKNVDVISVIQIGFLGTWGEWTPNYNDAAKNSAIIKGLLEALPKEYGLEARYTWIKNNATGHINASDAGRIGFCNDYFTTGIRNCGSDFCPGDDQYKQIANESFTTYVSGEVPYNEGPPWGFDVIMETDPILAIFKEHHYTAFDITQNFKDNITHWKTVKVHPDRLAKNNIFFDENYFLEENGEIVPRSFYQFVRDHLGYRLNIMDNPTLKVENGELVYDIKLTNTGFATVLNPKPVYLVLINENDQIAKEIELTQVNPKEWQPWKKGKPTELLTHTIAGTTPIDISGKYKVGIWIPDSQESIKLNAAYSIKFAVDNKNVTHWTNGDKTHTVNVIGEVQF